MKKWEPAFFFRIFFFYVPICFSQSSIGDSISRLLKSDKEDTCKVIHLYKLTRECELTGSYDEGIKYGKNAIELALKLNFKRGISQSNNNIGNIYFNLSDFTTALDLYLKAFKIDEEMCKSVYAREIYDGKIGMVMRLGNIGNVYKEQGDYPKALSYFLKALKMGEEMKNKYFQTVNLNNIGLLYFQQSDYPKSLDCFFKALKIGEETGSKNDIAAFLCNIGIVYDDQSKNEKTETKRIELTSKALYYYFKALKMAEELGDKNRIATALGNIAVVYDERGKNEKTKIRREELADKALSFYSRAMKIGEELGDKNLIAIHLGNVGALYFDLNKYKNAYNYLYRALAVSDSVGAKNNVKSWYEMLSTLYEKSNIALCDSIGGKVLNREQMRLRALYYHKRYISISDTLFSEESKKQLVRKEMNYEFEKKEANVKAEQDKKDVVAAADAKRQKIVLLLVSFVLLLVAIVAFIIFRSLRITRRQKSLIEKQKQLVEEHQKEILDSIYYARRIQRSLLTSERYIERNLNRLGKSG